MKTSYFGCMGYLERGNFPAGWPVPPAYYDPEVAMQSYRDGMAECRLAEEVGFDWVSLSEHHYSGNRTTPNPAVMAAAVAQQCRRVKIALLGQLLPILNPVRAAEEIGMLDNLTEGRLVVAFMRGTLSEDQVYDLNPVEGRDKLLEGMDLVLRALTEPQPFSWEGRYYNYRTVSVWPKPVQQPMPPAIVATRSDDTIKYAADNGLGLGIAYESVDATAAIVNKYRTWCAQAGWWPSADHIVYRGGICLAETDAQAEDFLNGLHARGVERGLSISSSLAQAVAAARAGRRYDSRASAGGPSTPTSTPIPTAPAAGASDTSGANTTSRPPRALLNFVGGPDTVARQLEELHQRCGVGVVDLAFQQPGMSHDGVMEQVELFGRRVLPRIKELGQE